MNEDPGTHQAAPPQEDSSSHGFQLPAATTQPEPSSIDQSATDAATPPPTPTIRPVFAATLLIIGWIVVVSLTGIGFTRYRNSASSATVATTNENGLLYLRTIHDRLTKW